MARRDEVRQRAVKCRGMGKWVRMMYPTPRPEGTGCFSATPSPYTRVPLHSIAAPAARRASRLPTAELPTLPALPAELPPPNCPAKYTESTQRTPPALANKGFRINRPLNFAFLRRLRPPCPEVLPHHSRRPLLASQPAAPVCCSPQRARRLQAARLARFPSKTEKTEAFESIRELLLSIQPIISYHAFF